MNERLNELRLDAGIAQLKDDPRLVVIDREGNVIDPLIGLEKFAKLIVKECLAKAEEEAELYRGFSHLGGAAEYAKVMHNYQLLLKEHFGVEE